MPSSARPAGPRETRRRRSPSRSARSPGAGRAGRPARRPVPAAVRAIGCASPPSSNIVSAATTSSRSRHAASAAGCPCRRSRRSPRAGGSLCQRHFLLLEPGTDAEADVAAQHRIAERLHVIAVGEVVDRASQREDARHPRRAREDPTTCSRSLIDDRGHERGEVAVDALADQRSGQVDRAARAAPGRGSRSRSGADAGTPSCRP